MTLKAFRAFRASLSVSSSLHQSGHKHQSNQTRSVTRWSWYCSSRLSLNAMHGCRDTWWNLNCFTHSFVCLLGLSGLLRTDSFDFDSIFRFISGILWRISGLFFSSSSPERGGVIGRQTNVRVLVSLGQFSSIFNYWSVSILVSIWSRLRLYRLPFSRRLLQVLVRTKTIDFKSQVWVQAILTSTHLSL